MTVLTICLSEGQADHARSQCGAQTQQGQPGAGAAGHGQRPVSTGQGSLDQGGEQEHMKQVCFPHAAHVMQADASVDTWKETP